MKLHLLIALGLAVSGCASSGPKIDASRLSEVRKGETTVAEVVTRFGRPSILSKNMDGTQTAAYMHAQGRSDAAAFVPLVAALAGNAEANVDSVVFHFDVKGVLSDYKTTHARAIKPAVADAEEATQTGVDKPIAKADKPIARARKSASGNPDPWTIELFPSGYRENR